jgi:hypothetical protein
LTEHILTVALMSVVMKLVAPWCGSWLDV